MKRISLLFILLISVSFYANSQISIGDSLPDSCATLDLQASDRGLMLPRLSTMQMNDISNPATGLVIYNKTVNAVYCFDGTIWNMIGNKDGQSCGDLTYMGQTYGTVIIGNQCWMAENLNVGQMIDGGSDQTDNSEFEKYCYNNIEDSCDIYGGLYQWDEVMRYTKTSGSQGMCPSGWHIPTDEEWKILEGSVDSLYAVGDPEWNGSGWRGFDAGKQLKSNYAWYSNGNGNDGYGFTALPAGYRNTSGSFEMMPLYAYFWTSDYFDDTFIYYRSFYHSKDGIGRSTHSKNRGFSVRCIKN
jgi:uncharacterized protein (TIGR02145 family)